MALCKQSQGQRLSNETKDCICIHFFEFYFLLLCSNFLAVRRSSGPEFVLLCRPVLLLLAIVCVCVCLSMYEWCRSAAERLKLHKNGIVTENRLNSSSFPARKFAKSRLHILVVVYRHKHTHTRKAALVLYFIFCTCFAANRLYQILAKKTQK